MKAMISGMTTLDWLKRTATITLPKPWCAAALLGALVACSGHTMTTSPSPAATAPSSIPSQSRSGAAPMTFDMSGVVTDESGAPVSGLRIGVYFDPESDPAELSAPTDAGGHYDVKFVAAAGDEYLPNLDPLGTKDEVGFVQVSDPRYEGYAAWILGTASTIIENIRLRHTGRMPAGTSTMLTIAPDDTICVTDVWPGRELICAIEHVGALTSGTLRLEVVPSKTDVAVPIIEAYGDHGYGRGNPISIPVTAGREYAVWVEIPWGLVASQSVSLETTMVATP